MPFLIGYNVSGTYEDFVRKERMSAKKYLAPETKAVSFAAE